MSMYTASILLILVLLLGAFFLGFVFPVIAIIHCATSSRRSNESKVVWIILMVLVWPLTSYLYGLVSAGRMWFKLAAGTGIVLTLLAILVLFGAVPFPSELDMGFLPSSSGDIFQIAPWVDLSELTPLQRRAFREALAAVQKELRSEFLAPDIRNKNSQLLQMYEVYIRDGVLSAAEYYEWMTKYERRADPRPFDWKDSLPDENAVQI